MRNFRQLILLAALAVPVSASMAQDSDVVKDEGEGRCLRTDRIWEYIHVSMSGKEVLHYAFSPEEVEEQPEYSVFRLIGRYSMNSNGELYALELPKEEYLLKEDPESGNIFSLVSEYSSSYEDIP